MTRPSAVAEPRRELLVADKVAGQVRADAGDVGLGHEVHSASGRAGAHERSYSYRCRAVLGIRTQPASSWLAVSEAAAGGRDAAASGRVGMSSPATTQQARNRADIANVLVNPVRAGRPSTVLAATNVAASWPPSAPPSVRSTVFIPVATPVCWAGTAWTIRLPSAANASPIPTPSSAELSSMSYGCRLAAASQPQATALTAAPAISASRELKRRSTRPATEPSTPMPSAHGSRYRPPATTEAP